MMKLYGFSRVNSLAYGLTRDLRVLWALEELELPFELVGLDHPSGQLDTQAYRHLNPFAQLPVLEGDGVGLLRCDPLIHPGAAYGTSAPRVRMLLRLPMSSYADALHRVLECVPDGEIGHLINWRTHLQRQGIAHGG